MTKRKRLILVSGCARSGTHLYADLLQSLGLDVGHEWFEQHGLVCHLSGGHRNASLYQLRIMLARNPLGVIRSCHSMRWRTWRQIGNFLDRDMFAIPMLRRTMLYWVEWNKLLLANMHPQITVRIETVKLKGDRRTRRRMPHYGRNVTWDMMQRKQPQLTDEVRDMARRLGYCDEELR